MTLGEHLGELRARLLLCVIALGVVFLAGMTLYQRLWNLVRWPLLQVAKALGKRPEDLVPIQLPGPLASVSVAAEVAWIAALVVVLPLLAYEAWMFVSPGLRSWERRLASWVFTAGSVLFALGVAFGFLLAAPLALWWLVWFGGTLEGAQNFWPFEEYLSFLLMITAGCGVTFEAPLVMLALARAGLIRPEGIRRYWRHSILLIVILAAAFTPPDPFTQLLLSGLLGFLYFVGYLLTCWATPHSSSPRNGKTNRSTPVENKDLLDD